jgi:fluoride exporter
VNQILLVGLGGAIGSIARYLISTRTYSYFGSGFPYGTLIVNFTGSFLIGLIAMFILERIQQFGMELRSFLIIGFLGGYTTFSSFSFETISLVQNGEYGSAFLNIFASLLLCLLATTLGIFLGRAI